MLHTEPKHHYDLVNIKGEQLCHATACHNKYHLNSAYNGLFCDKHLVILSGIRKRLNQAKYFNNKSMEIRERENEIRFRKIMDDGHVYYFYKIQS